MQIGRRSFLTGLMAAPIIVKAASLMPARPVEGVLLPDYWEFVQYGNCIITVNPAEDNYMITWSMMHEPSIWATHA